MRIRHETTKAFPIKSALTFRANKKARKPRKWFKVFSAGQNIERSYGDMCIWDVNNQEQKNIGMSD